MTVMRMEAGLDTGPICMAERTPIGADETAGLLGDRLARLLDADPHKRVALPLEQVGEPKASAFAQEYAIAEG